MLNELIREYLTFNKYNYTCSVLVTGMKCHGCDRELQFGGNEANLRGVNEWREGRRKREYVRD